MFEFDISDELRRAIERLSARDRKRLLALRRKMEEIIGNSHGTIDRYRNCSYSLKQYKHVHIDKSFVLFFRVDKEKNRILFVYLGHHDSVFKK